MKNKFFIQLHPIMVLINFFSLLMIIGFVVLVFIDPLMEKLLGGWKGIHSVLLFIVGYLSFLYFCWIVITINHNWIVFKEGYLYVPSDLRRVRNRRQHQVKVNYEEIENISFIRRTTNSKNKNIQDEQSNPFYHHYLVLFLKNGKKECFLVDYYTKKQKIKIMKEIINRAMVHGNYIDIAEVEEKLKSLGMFGSRFIIDIAEKDEKKRIKK